MRITSIASVPTTHADRYIAQLCKHWAHSLAVDLVDGRGRILFPRDARGADWPGEGEVVMIGAPAALECRVTASAPAQLEALQGTLARHLDRFAFREAPLAFDWSEAEAA